MMLNIAAMKTTTGISSEPPKSCSPCSSGALLREGTVAACALVPTVIAAAARAYVRVLIAMEGAFSFVAVFE